MDSVGNNALSCLFIAQNFELPMLMWLHLHQRQRTSLLPASSNLYLSENAIQQILTIT